MTKMAVIQNSQFAFLATKIVLVLTLAITFFE